MGLAGRDPIFFAQLESELAYLNDVRDLKTRADLKQTVVDTCMRCHGVTGKRQDDLDHPGGHFALEDLDATFPKGDAARDPDYRDSKGSDTVTYRIQLPPDVDPKDVSVQARLFYQSIPPYYLNHRFTASKGEATSRLYYLASTVNLASTPMEGWKIAIASASRSVVK